MRTVKLVIGFIGSRYEGWQSQTKNTSIQEVFETHLAQILKEKVPLISSSRTDSGVHAKALVAHFKTNSSLPDPKIKKALNFYLPRDILVLSAGTVSSKFHARFQAKSKIYYYDIWTSKTRPLFEAPFVLWYPQKLDITRMRKAAKYLKGRHDFSSFRDQVEEGKSAVRTIKRLNIKALKNIIRIEVEGSGFLRHMVRIIAGTLIEVGRKKIMPEAVRDILRSKNRKKAGPTAKPHGLTLIRVKY